MLKLKDVKRELFLGLVQAGIEESESRLEADMIIEHATGWDLSHQLFREDELIEEESHAVIKSILGRRRQREPLQYCLGYAYFMGLKLAIRPGVFIPRTDTETLVTVSVSLIEKLVSPVVCEIGPGSGAVSIGILKAVPAASVIAVDISPCSIALTRENALEHKVLDRLQLIACDWQNALPDQIDAIIANPPYIPAQSQMDLQPEIVGWEPPEALYGGDADGLAFYRALVARGVTRLKESGLVVVEIGDGQANQVSNIFASGSLKHIRVYKDLNQLPRVISAVSSHAGL